MGKSKDGIATAVLRHVRLCALLLLATLTSVGASADWMDNADRWLSHNWGKLLIKPQLDVSSMFSDNVFYGNESVLLTNYPTLVQVGVDANNAPVFVIENRTSPSNGTLSTNVFPARPVESEFLFYVSPGLKLQYGQNIENSIALDYSYDRIFYVNFPEFNTAQHRGALTTKLQLSRFTIDGSTRVDYLSSFLNGNNSSVRQQVDRVVWNDDYKITYDASMKTDFYVVGHHNRYDYQSAISIYDQETLRGTLGATYKWSERVGFFVEGDYGQSSINPNIASQVKGPHSVTYGGFIGARGDFSARFSGSLKVGYEIRSFPGDFPPGQEPASSASPAVGLDLTYTLGPKTLLRLTYDRRSDVSPQFGQQSYIRDGVRFTANQFIGTTGKWLVTVTGGADFGDFSETPGRNNARTDRVINGGIRLVYQPRTWLATILAYDYENYSSEFQDPAVAASTLLVDYQVNTVRLTFVIGY